MIRVTELHKSFGDTEILKGVSTLSLARVVPEKLYFLNAY